MDQKPRYDLIYIVVMILCFLGTLWVIGVPPNMIFGIMASIVAFGVAILTYLLIMVFRNAQKEQFVKEEIPQKKEPHKKEPWKMEKYEIAYVFCMSVFIAAITKWLGFSWPIVLIACCVSVLVSSMVVYIIHLSLYPTVDKISDTLQKLQHIIDTDRAGIIPVPSPTPVPLLYSKRFVIDHSELQSLESFLRMCNNLAHDNTAPRDHQDDMQKTMSAIISWCKKNLEMPFEDLRIDSQNPQSHQ